MKSGNKSRYLLPLICGICLLFSACGSSAGITAAVAPFSDASWESTAEDILALEGESTDTYDSLYGGICYTYAKSYDGYDGTVKYMMDEQDRLMCVAWAYSSDSEEELSSLYKKIQDPLTSQYGDTSYDTNKATNYGNVWYREEGNIIVSTMITSELKSLQYAYLHPSVSTPADASEDTTGTVNKD